MTQELAISLLNKEEIYLTVKGKELLELIAKGEM